MCIPFWSKTHGGFWRTTCDRHPPTEQCAGADARRRQARRPGAALVRPPPRRIRAEYLRRHRSWSLPRLLGSRRTASVVRHTVAGGARSALMLKYFVKRLGTLVPILFGVSVVVFV